MQKIIFKKSFSLSILLSIFLLSTAAFADCPDMPIDCFDKSRKEKKRLTEESGTCWQQVAGGDFFGYGCRWCNNGQKAASEKCVKQFGADFSVPALIIGQNRSGEVYYW